MYGMTKTTRGANLFLRTFVLIQKFLKSIILFLGLLVLKQADYIHKK